MVLLVLLTGVCSVVLCSWQGRLLPVCGGRLVGLLPWLVGKVDVDDNDDNGYDVC